jgi:hypothetical protein
VGDLMNKPSYPIPVKPDTAGLFREEFLFQQRNNLVARSFLDMWSHSLLAFALAEQSVDARIIAKVKTGNSEEALRARFLGVRPFAPPSRFRGISLSLDLVARW